MRESPRQVWYIPDCEMPPPGSGPLLGHESVIVLNPGTEDAHLTVTLYFSDRPPVSDIAVTVGAQRVRCLRTNRPSDFRGVIIPPETQYAMRLCATCPVVIQYGRLDTRQANMAFYTTLGMHTDPQ